MQLFLFCELLNFSLVQIAFNSFYSAWDQDLGKGSYVMYSFYPQLQQMARFFIQSFLRIRVALGYCFDRSTNIFSLLGPTAYIYKLYKLQPKLQPYLREVPVCFSSNLRWMFLMERQRLSSILYDSRSISPDFSFSSDFYLLLEISYSPTCLMVLFTRSIMAWARYYPLKESLENWQRRRRESIVMTNGLSNRFFHGILMLNPLIEECLMMMGILAFCSTFFFSLRFFIAIFPDQIPTLSSLESISSMNSPSRSLSIFSKYFSNIFDIQQSD